VNDRHPVDQIDGDFVLNQFDKNGGNPGDGGGKSRLNFGTLVEQGIIEISEHDSEIS
jgi:hypothetical protein